jgi:hypothetical protein
MFGGKQNIGKTRKKRKLTVLTLLYECETWVKGEKILIKAKQLKLSF